MSRYAADLAEGNLSGELRKRSAELGFTVSRSSSRNNLDGGAKRHPATDKDTTLSYVAELA